jgi:TonB family protein
VRPPSLLFVPLVLAMSGSNHVSAQQPGEGDRAARAVNPEAMASALTRRYPATWERLGIGGTVRLKAFVHPTGKPDSVRITYSSGIPTLDSAARSVVRDGTFEPALEAGSPVASWVELALSFGEPTELSAGRPPTLPSRDEQRQHLRTQIPAAFTKRAIDEAVIVVLDVAGDGRVTDVRLPAPVCVPEAADAAGTLARALAFERAADPATPLRTTVATLTFVRDSVSIQLLGDSDPPPRPREAREPPARSGESRRPTLRNVDHVRRELGRHYETLHRSGIVTGEARVWIFVDERGRVARRRLSESTGRCELDRAALDVAAMMSFTPARIDGRPTAVWVEIPIQFGRQQPDLTP